jgi:hypothetical protein
VQGGSKNASRNRGRPMTIASNAAVVIWRGLAPMLHPDIASGAEIGGGMGGREGWPSADGQLKRCRLRPVLSSSVDRSPNPECAAARGRAVWNSFQDEGEIVPASGCSGPSFQVVDPPPEISPSGKRGNWSLLPGGCVIAKAGRDSTRG